MGEVLNFSLFYDQINLLYCELTIKVTKRDAQASLF